MQQTVDASLVVLSPLSWSWDRFSVPSSVHYSMTLYYYSSKLPSTWLEQWRAIGTGGSTGLIPNKQTQTQMWGHEEETS